VAEPSTRALAADLIGDDPLDPAERRPTVEAALARCRPGQVLAARRGDEPVVVFLLGDGRAFVSPDRCPHDGGWLSDGFVDGDRLVCARHNWEFEACTGRCPGRNVWIPVQRLQAPARTGARGRKRQHS
jgi:nitrite reductase/ring-hydroxylating ferredoxin subunit